MTEQDTPKMTHDEMIDVLKGLVFGTFDRTTAKEREALDMAISALSAIEKIRAEIEDIDPITIIGAGVKQEILEIIDKHIGGE